MKIALALSGFYGNRENSNAGDAGYQYLKETLLDKYDVDVFFHTYNYELRDKIRDQYRAITNITGPNGNWGLNLRNRGITSAYFDKGFDRNNSIFNNCKIEYTISFLHSRYKAINLALEQDTKYDVIIATRFDIGQRGGDSVRYLKFDPTLDMTKIYSAQWDQHNAGYADMWFYSNPENMEILAGAYPAVYTDFLPGSDYEKAVTQGWPDSHMTDNSSFTDPGQFTNERFLPESEKATELMKYPRWQCINNHLYYKWYFMKSGLYNKSKFL